MVITYDLSTRSKSKLFYFSDLILSNIVVLNNSKIARKPAFGHRLSFFHSRTKHDFYLIENTQI